MLVYNVDFNIMITDLDWVIISILICFLSPLASILKGCIKIDYLIFNQKSPALAILCRNVILSITVTVKCI